MSKIIFTKAFCEFLIIVKKTELFKFTQNTACIPYFLHKTPSPCYPVPLPKITKYLYLSDIHTLTKLLKVQLTFLKKKK